MRRKRQDDGEDYVCPMNEELPKHSGFERGQLHFYEEDLDQVRTNLRASFYYLNRPVCVSS